MVHAVLACIDINFLVAAMGPVDLLVSLLDPGGGVSSVLTFLVAAFLSWSL